MNKLIIVIGAYGSGKSEYSINLARELQEQGENVSLADLDVVNPYFRSRDVRETFEKLGIDVIAPEGEFKHADLPMISRRAKSAVNNYDRTVILDVGGDPAGCRTLGRFVADIKKRGYEMHLVINTKRPFTTNLEDINRLIESLEFASRLKISKFVCNTNLMEYTNEEIVANGVALVSQVAEENKVDFDEYLVLDKYNEIIPDGLEGKKKKVLSYYLNKPWEDDKKCC